MVTFLSETLDRLTVLVIPKNGTVVCQASRHIAIFVVLLSCATKTSTISLHHGGWVHRHDRQDYDLSSCWLMKPRYNCMGDKRRPLASEWWHVPDTSVHNITWRDLLVKRDGRTSDLAEQKGLRGAIRACVRYLRKRIPQQTPKNTEIETRVTVTNMLLAGDSQLRQIFQAMACRWRDFITGGSLIVGPLNRTNPFERHDDKRILFKKSDTVLKPLEQIRRPAYTKKTFNPPCHHDIRSSSYYKGGKFPFKQEQVEPICKDDVAMIEYLNTLRVYYVFRSYAFEGGLETVLQDHLKINPENVDVVVHNDLQNLNINWARKNQRSDMPHFLDFSDVREELKLQMARDATTKYGATNAILKDDFHPCLPGIPDDEIDILFTALLTNSSILKDR